MKRRRDPRLPRAAALLYWLLVLSGIGAFALVRPDDLGDFVPLGAGAILGTGLGQLLAKGRLRMWLVLLILANLLWFGLILMAPFGGLMKSAWSEGLDGNVNVVELALIAFVPAVVCGYLALSERAALAAFWFPVAVWMLSVLEGGEGRGLAQERSWLLLAGLAALFVLFLRARETRRIALWRQSAARRLSVPLPPVLLRQSPLRAFARLGWIAVTGAGAVALTAWVAPYLWQSEKLEDRTETMPVAPLQPPAHVSALTPQGSLAAGVPVTQESTPPTCCPEPTVVDVPRARVREYVPLVHAHGANAYPRPATAGCVACSEGVPVLASGTVGDPTWSNGTDPQTWQGAGAGLTGPAPSQDFEESPPSPLQPVGASPPPPSAPPAISPPPSRDTALMGPAFTPLHRVSTLSGTAPNHALEWLFVTVGLGLALEIGLRPIRRHLLLRHLRSGLWPETVDQRVSNLWQLMLVGLRDGGWHSVSGEQPEELARRVGVPEAAGCAAVLERARHGVRVEPRDLASMTRDAQLVYRVARRRAGLLARAAAWLRWPLI